MFKKILLAVLVSVVWSTTSATYILDDNSGYRILSDSKFGSFHEPFYQTHLDVDYDIGNHGYVLPQISAQDIPFFQQHIRSLPRLIDESSRFRIPKTFQNRGVHENTNIYHRNNANREANQNIKVTQQQIEVKVGNDNYNQPQANNQGAYQNSHANRKVPSSGISIHGFSNGGDYSGNHGQAEIAKQVNQNSQYISDIQSNIQDLVQQKFYIVSQDQTTEPKLENKDNSQDYSKEGQISTTDARNNHDQKSNQQSSNDKSLRFDTNYNSPAHRFQSNEKTYPVLYNEGHLGQAEYIKFHGDNVEGYAHIPRSYGSTGAIYREIGEADGIRYHPDVNSNVAVRLDHSTPFLIANNFHGNFNDHDGILVRLRDDDESIKSVLGDSIAYDIPGNNTSHSKDNNSPSYPENNENNYALNLQQKSVEVNIKSVAEQSNAYNNLGDSGSEYKGIGSIDASQYSDNGKSDLPSNVEQKSLDISIKDESGQTNYGVTSSRDQQDDGKKNSDVLNYPDNSGLNLEQKSIDSNSKAEYEVSTITYTASKNEGSDIDAQQKSVDIAFKSDDAQSEYKNLGGSGSEYSGIGSIDIPKYPTSSKESSVTKVEQKSVESGNYQEVKSELKVSSKAGTGIFSSSKTDSDYKNSGLKDYKEETDEKTYQTPSFEYQATLGKIKNSGYPSSSGVTSTSYFDAGHPLSRNTENYQRRDNTFKYPNSGNSVRSGFTGSSYTGNSGNLPRQRGNYFGSAKQSFGTTGNYPRITPSAAINKPYGGTSRENYQRPNSPTAQSYFEISGLKSPVSEVNTKYTHQQPSYHRRRGNPTYSGIQGFSQTPSIPKYRESVSGGISIPRYSDSPDIYNNEKFVKVTREYPQQSLKSNANPYQSSAEQPIGIRKPNAGTPVHYQAQNPHQTASRYPSSISDTLSASRINNYSPGSSGSYLKKDNAGHSNAGSSYNANTDGGSSILGGIDYASGIGSVEYHGIGESSSPSVATREKPYSSLQDTKSEVTEQKPYSNEEDSISGIKSETTYPSGEEYKGIGEIGSTPELKSQIVGGRYPIRKPLKTASVKTKSSPSGVKGKSEVKTEQKYLPITSALSDAKSESSDSRPLKKRYDASIKTATEAPEKIEQQDLVYEAFLAGEGPQTHARGSSGYGFTRPAVTSGGSGGDPYKDEHAPPMPYEFEYDIKDDEHGSEQYRREKMDNSGQLTGSYGFRDAEGIFREVEYEASKEGFKVNRIKTNEPGTDNENPADVIFEVQKHS